MVKVKAQKTPAQPVSIQDFERVATQASADGKLTSKEKTSIRQSFNGLDRFERVQGLELLKTSSPALAKFAGSDGTLIAAAGKRVGGDVSIDQFRGAVDRAAAQGGIKDTEIAGLVRDFRALGKADQATAIAEARGRGEEKLAKALEGAVLERTLTKKQTAAVGSKSFADFEHALAGFKNGAPSKGLVDVFKKLTVEDQERAVGSIKEELPKLAGSLDRILNPRPLPDKMRYFDVVS